MGKKGRRPKHADDARELSDRFNEALKSTTKVVSMANVENHVADLERRLRSTSDPLMRIEIMKEQIETTGTKPIDEQNREDPHGNGDQSLLQNDRQCQVFRNMWADGFDLDICRTMGLFSPFLMSCIAGDVPSVKAALSKAIPEQRHEMLERRQTVFRASAIVIMTGFSKFPALLRSQVNQRGNMMDHLGVARELLKFGANPRVQDASGKTMIHWGSGNVSTPLTRTIAGWCIHAARSSVPFGQPVTLGGLASKTHNNLEGVLGGYDVDSNRRVVMVHLNGEDKEILIKAENIFHDGKCISEPNFNLADVRDRLGYVALHELVMNGDPDAAKFLCFEHNASVDVEDISGCSIRFMSMRPMMGLESESMRIIKQHACRSNAESQACANCFVRGKDLSKCARCGEVFYCDRECQVDHWPLHKKKCQPKKGIVLRKPQQNNMSVLSRNGSLDGSYSRPSNVKVGENFWVKVQCAAGNENAPHLLYDLSRECQMHVMPGTPGHPELKKAVRNEKASLGSKTHFQAKFDEKGDLTIFPHTAKLLSW